MRAHWRRGLKAGAGVLAVVIVLFACAVIAGPQAGGGTPGKPTGLKVNLVSQPMTVSARPGPWFSWVTSDARAGESQRGYQLRVAASPAGLVPGRGALWDSGPVTSADPDASYAGPPLSAGTRYWWTVRTTDAQGRTGLWSAPAQFGTALGATW